MYDGAIDDDGRFDAILRHAREGGFDTLDGSNIPTLEPHVQRPGGLLDRLERGHDARRIPEHGDPGQSRRELLEQLELLGGNIGSSGGHARDVPTRSSEARDQSRADRVGDQDRDDRDALGGVPGPEGR